MPHSASGFLIFVGLLAGIGPATAAQSLDGCGVFKFGMSPAQVRAIAGQSFGRYAPNSQSGQDIGVMGSKNDAEVYGIPYSFTLFFNRLSHTGVKGVHGELILPQTLSEISLENEKVTSKPDCEK